MGPFDPFQVDKGRVNKTRQEMYRHLQLHLPVISLIKDNIYMTQITQEKKVQELFRVCFAVLTAFVKENEENQLVLSHFLVVFLYSIDSNLGHVKLLLEIFRDNLELCTTKVGDIATVLVNVIMTTGRKAEYLEFFKVIQKVKGKVLFDNQKLVLDSFLNPDSKQSLLYLASDNELQYLDKTDHSDYRNNYPNFFG